MNTCKLCGGNIPFSLIIDGKRRFLNKRKYCLICSPFNGHNRRDLKSLGAIVDGVRVCSCCKLSKPLNEFYYHTGNKAIRGTCKDCERKDRYERLQMFKRECVEYKGGKCSICGYDKCLASLDFHHTNQDDKEFNISGMRFGYRVTDGVKKELDKCILVCRNCHSEIHVSKLGDGGTVTHCALDARIVGSTPTPLAI